MEAHIELLRNGLQQHPPKNEKTRTYYDLVCLKWSWVTSYVKAGNTFFLFTNVYSWSPVILLSNQREYFMEKLNKIEEKKNTPEEWTNTEDQGLTCASTFMWWRIYDVILSWWCRSAGWCLKSWTSNKRWIISTCPCLDCEHWECRCSKVKLFGVLVCACSS